LRTGMVFMGMSPPSVVLGIGLVAPPARRASLVRMVETPEGARDTPGCESAARES
jgi:hypothetical protein